MRYLFVFMMTSGPALAHDGFHHHPHGVDYGWMIAALVGLLGGIIMARVRK